MSPLQLYDIQPSSIVHFHPHSAIGGAVPILTNNPFSSEKFNAVDGGSRAQSSVSLAVRVTWNDLAIDCAFESSNGCNV